MFKKYRILILSIILIIIVGFIAYKTYEGFQFVECNTLKNCKSCSASFGCLWCKTSNKCVSDISANILCPRESKVSDPFGCEIGEVEDISGSEINSPLFGKKCSANKDCSGCLRSPGCFWCNNSKQCAGSIELYAKCKDDVNIFDSFYQCAASENSIPETRITFNINDSVIPLQGLSRNTDGSLTLSSLKIIFDSFTSKGMPIQDMNSKQKALNQINKEMNFFKNEFKSNMNSYVNSTIDFVNDPKSLEQAKIVDQKLKDLRDVSRYISDAKFESFQVNNSLTNLNTKMVESFVDTYQKDNFDYTLQKNRYAARYLELFWLGNILALGTLYYFMKI